MNRRSFFSSLAAAGVLAPSAQTQPNRKTHFYRMDYFSYRQGDQGNRINRLFESQMPLLTKHIHTLGIFTGVLTPHLQTTLVLSGFASNEEMFAAGHAVEGDSGYQKAWDEFERGAEPPYDTAERHLLVATDFSPEIVPPAEKPKSPRYFELRIYHSPTARQLRLVHERFAGPEIALFHKHGVHPIFYADTIFGSEIPNVTYMIPFATLAERETAWDKFGADPEWLKVRAESIAKGGQMVAYNNITMWRATPFSPIQ